MARYNEILTGRHNRMFQKLFSMKGGPPAPQLSSEIQPVLPLLHGRENRYLEAWQIFGTVASIGGAAGNQSCIRLRNPTTSNVIVVLEKVFVSFTQPNRLQVIQGGATTDLASLSTQQNLAFDPRGNPGCSLILSNQNTTVSAPPLVNQQIFYDRTTQGAVQENFDIILTDNQEMPILPGFAQEYIIVAVNQALFLSLFWRERFLEDSERT